MYFIWTHFFPSENANLCEIFCRECKKTCQHYARLLPVCCCVLTKQKCFWYITIDFLRCSGLFLAMQLQMFPVKSAGYCMALVPPSLQVYRIFLFFSFCLVIVNKVKIVSMIQGV